MHSFLKPQPQTNEVAQEKVGLFPLATTLDLPDWCNKQKNNYMVLLYNTYVLIIAFDIGARLRSQFFKQRLQTIEETFEHLKSINCV